MKLNLKEEPKEWRKAALFGTLGFALLSTVLRWRHILPAKLWLAILIFLILVALAAVMFPRWFRPYYRFTSRIAFHISQFIGTILLGVLFIFIVTPLGAVRRVMGKDPLKLKRSENATTYWTPARESSPLDRLF